MPSIAPAAIGRRELLREAAVAGRFKARRNKGDPSRRRGAPVYFFDTILLPWGIESSISVRERIGKIIRDPRELEMRDREA
jgi:hypothetical protein